MYVIFNVIIRHIYIFYMYMCVICSFFHRQFVTSKNPYFWYNYFYICHILQAHPRQKGFMQDFSLLKEKLFLFVSVVHRSGT